ncbi:Decaprenyl-diphosphate synthase subunit 1 [Schistosoma japonicum]|nr:Decaprenyl-diphosphate synthase subunit 1 [Schistosoma japonicum]
MVLSDWVLSSRPLYAGVKRLTHSSVYLSRLADHDSKQLLQKALADIHLIVSEIKHGFCPAFPVFRDLLHYQFESHGKLVRPLLVTLAAACSNSHMHFNTSTVTRYKSSVTNNTRNLAELVSSEQHEVAKVTEMIHTASLIHDDLIDSASIRRGKTSTYKAFGHREAVLGGDFILTHSSRLLARIGDTRVIAVLSQVIEDLIHGEMMQLSTNSDDDDKRFQAYLTKTYRKTASLIANSCKAVAMLTVPTLSQRHIDDMYDFGKHLGMAFQLIDDVLDFVTDEAKLGKPSGADLQMGIATGPVLFAAQRYPELNTILLRQFSLDGDTERALELVQQSDGVGQTRMLAEFHFQAAQRCLFQFRDSLSRKALLHVAANFLQRDR